MIPADFKTYKKRTTRPFKSANWLLFYEQKHFFMDYFGFSNGYKTARKDSSSLENIFKGHQVHSNQSSIYFF